MRSHDADDYLKIILNFLYITREREESRNYYFEQLVIHPTGLIYKNLN